MSNVAFDQLRSEFDSFKSSMVDPAEFNQLKHEFRSLKSDMSSLSSSRIVPTMPVQTPLKMERKIDNATESKSVTTSVSICDELDREGRERYKIILNEMVKQKEGESFVSFYKRFRGQYST